jgi:predicted  nucleic acid-binding Zn-ribbon protein
MEEVLRQILEELGSLRSGQDDIKKEINVLKRDVREIKRDVKAVWSDILRLDNRIADQEEKISRI